jgi:hypothetical protein
VRRCAGTEAIVGNDGAAPAGNMLGRRWIG